VSGKPGGISIFFVDLFEDLWWEYWNISNRFTVGQ
jgi:hypothetical protein